MALKIDTTNLNKFFPTSIKLGKYEIELRNYKRVMGHDDSLPYQASLYVNGKRVADAFNDGWGGISTIRPTKGNEELVGQVSDYLVEHGKEFPCEDKYFNLELYYDTLDFVCDTLAEHLESRKEIEKWGKKKMVIFDPETKNIATLSYNGLGSMTIPQALETMPKFRELWESGKQKRLNEGKLILNDYELPPLSKAV